MRVALLLLFSIATLAAQDFIIRNATIVPVSGPRIENGSILVLGGKIADLGPKVPVPKTKGFPVIEGKGLSIYPGMIDSGTQLGVSEISSVRETVDTGELGEFNPQLRPLIAINPETEHTPVVRANGITSAIVLPAGGGGGAFIGGQVSLINLQGWTWEEMEIQRTAAMHLRFPVARGATFNTETFSVQRGSFQQARQNKESDIGKIRSFFESARRYKAAKEARAEGFSTDLKLEAMLPVLERKTPLMVMAAREREIREALEFADAERVRIVLAGVRRPGKQLEAIAKKKIAVIAGPTLTTPLEEDDPYDEPYTFPAELHKAGVKFAFGSMQNQFARNLPYQAAMATAFGLPADEALKAVTLNAAEIWGVADRYGSLEKGKFANLLITDGDPLEVRTRVLQMFIHGRPVDLESKHTRLYRKWLARP